MHAVGHKLVVQNRFWEDLKWLQYVCVTKCWNNLRMRWLWNMKVNFYCWIIMFHGFTKQVLQCNVIKLSLLSYRFGPPALTTWLLCLGISLLWAVGVQFMLSFLDNVFTLSHSHFSSLAILRKSMWPVHARPGAILSNRGAALQWFSCVVQMHTIPMSCGIVFTVGLERTTSLLMIIMGTIIELQHYVCV